MDKCYTYYLIPWTLIIFIHYQVQGESHVLPEFLCIPVVIEAVVWHLENLVGLSQAVPGSVVSFVHLCNTIHY